MKCVSKRIKWDESIMIANHDFESCCETVGAGLCGSCCAGLKYISTPKLTSKVAKPSTLHYNPSMMAISARIKEDVDLTARIKKKFSIKCTTGYSINSLVDFDEPKEMIKHLMVRARPHSLVERERQRNRATDSIDAPSAFVTRE